LSGIKQVKLHQEALLNIFEDFAGPSKNVQNESREVDIYLSMNPISILSNPLQWWRTNQGSLKILSLIAKDLLAIPATSSASERVFSKSGHIVSRKRSALASKNVDVLVFLSENQNK